MNSRRVDSMAVRTEAEYLKAMSHSGGDFPKTACPQNQTRTGRVQSRIVTCQHAAAVKGKSGAGCISSPSFQCAGAPGRTQGPRCVRRGVVAGQRVVEGTITPPALRFLAFHPYSPLPIAL